MVLSWQSPVPPPPSPQSPFVVEWANRAALFSRWKAKLDGVPVELGLWTVKKEGCIYDFTYTSPRGGYDEQSQALARLVQGFGTERVK